MQFNVSELDARYDFDITGTSYIGDPRDGTVLFATAKVRRDLDKLHGHHHCLLFLEQGLDVPGEWTSDNCVVYSENPVAAYGRFAQTIRKREQILEDRRRRTLTEGGYWIGENVTIGENAVIEPGCLIDHDTVIGRDARIGYGTVIRHTVIGNGFQCGAYARIGEDAFFPAEENGQIFRIPSFGNVEIGNCVDIGSHVVIERGFNSRTILHDMVMADAEVCIGHDDLIGERVRIACGVKLAGMITIGPDAYLGVNASVKQRLSIGERAVVGMGSVVISHVPADASVFGIPARKMRF
ncbi:MAG: hypothetical protein IJK38_11480 [Oscillospiraceae bacterium]|nr:hypothetical protein [Oscillospiraceae bacterium]